MLKEENTGLREDLSATVEEEIILEEITGEITKEITKEVMVGEKEHIQIGEIARAIKEVMAKKKVEATAAEIIPAEKTEDTQDLGIKSLQTKSIF